MCERFGQPLMPWQRMVADVGGELDPDTGIPVYREVVFTTPRQSGKTSLVLGWECQRAIGWEHLGPQRMAYSAQPGGSRKKFVEDQKPILERHLKALGIRRIYEAMGSEGVVWDNGSRLGLLNNTEHAGHGSTIDLGVKDELFADYDNRRDQALIPAMSTRAAAQILACSTAGTEDSTPWNRLVDRGRLAVELGQRDGLAYFEWSATEDTDLDNPATWWGFMPALGHTIGEAAIRHAHDTMAEGEFRRAYGNLKTSGDERVIPAKNWEAVCHDVSPSRPLTFALDMNPERTGGAIVAASANTAELIPPRSDGTWSTHGVGWLVPRAVELDASHGPARWLVDAGGPAASLIPDLERQGLRVEPVAARELIDACGAFYDGVMDAAVSVRQHARLDEAAAGAAKRQVGDAWAWTRKSAAADISPLVAATLALWGARQPPEADSEPFMVVT